MQLSWPERSPAYGAVVLRPFRDSDLTLVADLSEDPYLPTIGTVPHPFTDEAGLAYLAASTGDWPTEPGGPSRSRTAATIELSIEAWNAGSIAVAARAGFALEGLLCSHQEIGGTRRDVLLFAAVRAADPSTTEDLARR